MLTHHGSQSVLDPDQMVSGIINKGQTQVCPVFFRQDPFFVPVTAMSDFFCLIPILIIRKADLLIKDPPFLFFGRPLHLHQMFPEVITVMGGPAHGIRISKDIPAQVICIGIIITAHYMSGDA